MDRRLLAYSGINYEEGLRRFGGNSKRYEKFLSKFFDNNYYYDLKESIIICDYNKAFMCAYRLKGIMGNLSMTTHYNIMCEIVDYLRNSDNKLIENKKLLMLMEKSDKLIDTFILAISDEAI